MNGVVVESAPTSVAALLRGSWVARIYPLDAILAGRFDAAAKVRRLGAPLLVIHGKRDPIVPAAMGVELYLRATGQKRLLLVDGAAHSDAATVGGAEYETAVERMLPPLREPALATALKPIQPAPIRERLRRAPVLPSGPAIFRIAGDDDRDPRTRRDDPARRPAIPVRARMPVPSPVAVRPGARRRAALRGDALERPARLAGDPARGDPRGAHGRSPRFSGAMAHPDFPTVTEARVTVDRNERAFVGMDNPAHDHYRRMFTREFSVRADARAQAADPGDRRRG